MKGREETVTVSDVDPSEWIKVGSDSKFALLLNFELFALSVEYRSNRILPR